MRLRNGDEHLACWERRELPHHFKSEPADAAAEDLIGAEKVPAVEHSQG
jgi:hypothetical protein